MLKSSADFVREVAGFGHGLLCRGWEPVREISCHGSVEPLGGLLVRQGREHVDGETLVISYGRQDGDVGEIFPEIFYP